MFAIFSPGENDNNIALKSREKNGGNWQQQQRTRWRRCGEKNRQVLYLFQLLQLFTFFFTLSAVRGELNAFIIYRYERHYVWVRE